jgi:hypothetical protein
VSPALPYFEREEDWLEFRDSVFEGIQPVGGLEMALADQVATGLWRQMRVIRYERETTAASQADWYTDLWIEAKLSRRPAPTQMTPEVKKKADVQAMRRMIPGGSRLNDIMRYQSMLRREVAQAMRHLERLQRARKQSGEMAAVREVFRGFGPRNGGGLLGDGEL